MNKMNPEIKAKWVEALRSGKYQQGDGSLRRIGPEGELRYCCLGVLCDLEDPDGWEGSADYECRYGHRGQVEFPGVDVEVSTGLKGISGVYGDAMIYLAESNDDGKSFAEIADWIEENL